MISTADVATLQAATDIYHGSLGSVKSITGTTASLTLQPYPLSLMKKSEAKGVNSLGLKLSDGHLVSLLLLSYWQSRSDDDAAICFMKDSLGKIKQDAASHEQLLPFVYMNYRWTQQDPISSNGAENKENLRARAKSMISRDCFIRSAQLDSSQFPDM